MVQQRYEYCCRLRVLVEYLPGVLSEHLADVSARRACVPQVYFSLRTPSRYTLEVVIRAYLASAPSWVSLPATRPRAQSGTQQQDKQKDNRSDLEGFTI